MLVNENLVQPVRENPFRNFFKSFRHFFLKACTIKSVPVPLFVPVICADGFKKF